MDTAAIVPVRSSALVPREDVALTFEELFEAADGSTVATLLAAYKVDRARVERIAAIFSDRQDRAVVQHFLDAARDRHGYTPSPDDLFGQVAPAMTVLNARYWQRVLETTDVYEAMPQPRRDAWNKSIEERNTPDFEDATVLATLQRLLADRKIYFAEKVDGVFRALSGDHKTNLPTGFSKRMILQGVYDGYHSTHRCGYVSDLREVVAKFMGRAVPHYLGTWEAVKYAREYCRGEWVTLDGGALRIRVYTNGNGHLEVHPEMAWRLNCVLASIYPHAIASEHRQRPRKMPKDWPLYSRPLPFAVLGLLQHGDVAKPVDAEGARIQLRENRYVDDEDITPARIAAAVHAGWRFTFHFGSDDGPVRDEACRVLEALGATRVRAGCGIFDFPYDPRAVLREVTASGCLPDVTAHQYYPTPPDLAARVVELAKIGSDHLVLEPSAGQGALADLLPKGRTQCIEVNELHAAILRAKEHRVVCADFLADVPVPFYHRVVMNPPFSDGRWRAHLEHAAGFVVAGGRLVAVLPESAKGKAVLPGWSCSWTEPVAYAGVSIRVVVLVADRAA